MEAVHIQFRHKIWTVGSDAISFLFLIQLGLHLETSFYNAESSFRRCGKTNLKSVIIVVNCERCGLPLPVGAEYCPNCGVPIRKKPEVSIPLAAPVAKLIEAGLLGASLAIMVSFFVPEGIDVYFLPSFLGALGAILLFRARRLDEALIIAFGVYLFTDAIITVLNLSSLFLSNMSWIDLANEIPSLYDELNNPPSLTNIIMYVASPISAVVAAYLGYKLMPKPRLQEATPYSYRRKEEQGGIVYSINNEKQKPSAKITHKV